MGHEIEEKELADGRCFLGEDNYWPKFETPKYIELSIGGMDKCWGDMGAFPPPYSGKVMLTNTNDTPPCRWGYAIGPYRFWLQLSAVAVNVSENVVLDPPIWYWGRLYNQALYFSDQIALGALPKFKNNIVCVLGTPACRFGTAYAHMELGTNIPHLLAQTYGLMTQDDSLCAFSWVDKETSPESCTKLCNISDHSHVDIKFDSSEKWQLDNLG